jgi:hypothetical protein
MFMVIQLIELFKCLVQGNDSSIQLNDISNFISVFGDKMRITTKELPPKSLFGNGNTHVRDIDIHPPIIMGTESHGLLRINRDRIHIESNQSK